MMKGGSYIPGKPKKTRQGSGKNSYAPATSRNKAKETISWTRALNRGSYINT